MNETLINRTKNNFTDYSFKPHDRLNPDAWDALYLDQMIPIDPYAKSLMIKDLQNWTRRYLLIPIKMIANLLLAIILIIKRLIPFQFRSYQVMHRLAAWFLNTFVTPEACYLIVRHFSLESNIINFLIDNGPNTDIEKANVYPRSVLDLANNSFLEHDLTFYNFVLDYAKSKKTNKSWLTSIKSKGINYKSIQNAINVEIDFSNQLLHFLDLESTLELFKIIYSFFLTPIEFERAVISLSMDENIANYINIFTENLTWNYLISNRHPLAPRSSFHAAHQLLMHGILFEYLHYNLESKSKDENFCHLKNP
jgi:hypothetical protein